VRALSSGADWDDRGDQDDVGTDVRGRASLRIALLGRADDVHVQRWVEALAARDIDLTLVTQHPPVVWGPPQGVGLRVLPFRGRVGYFANAVQLRRVLRALRPDLLNVHYASGYGTTAAIAGFRPTVLSVYGSDVFDFPTGSWLAGRLIRWNLHRAQRLASTSRVMAAQVRSLVPDVGPIDITPFGVDTSVFRPREGRGADGGLTIGTVKVLADKYGVDVLIRAFARLVSDPDLQSSDRAAPLRLVIVGDGPQRGELEALAARLGIARRTRFAGRVVHREVPDWLNRLDVFVAASRLDSESFGVAVIEASSCGLPVVVSDAGGLPEVVVPDVTGLIVPRNDDEALYRALARLVVDDQARARMGDAGRAFVQREYEWDACVDRMLDVYRSVVAGPSALRTPPGSSGPGS
jgi:glycosyltransferase involved in cell wall biosynthesis